MNLEVRKRFVQGVNEVLRRTFTKTASTCSPRGYDDEGKTTLHIMNREQELGLMIDGFSQVGFRLNNHMTVLGPMVIFSRSVLSWNVGTIADVNEDSFSLFKILEPKIDILVLGTGDKVDNHNFFSKFLKFSKEYRIAFEVQPTETACATFNFLNAEGRNVVGCLIPPDTIRVTEDDEFKTQMRYKNSYART
ncbi:NADH dehydrogenase [ubiquinone] 1 alpha subcomplex assembly factor 3 [Anthonomus grandis grandis]|uniref:NADH dehydrogenase [ubiquinone] 1 alpha subcomplex assembly factor 3 n=1 Tax=Anthonomus grandis grandis TaxID=2921223 RepID=UPI002165FF83|nr:NADH dehydrogenase [ubiquinone] 1 alpha subcomplex assembly factor 3 [Anthonomus grandis grandis]